jgi:ATP-dependent Lon protease
MLYDNFYKITFDGSKITYILTANYIDKIPDTITSRVIRLNFRPYTKDEMIDIVIPNIYQSFLKDENIVKSKFPQTLPRETCQVISEIYKEQPRQVPLYFHQIASKSFDKERGIVSMVLKEKDRDEFLRLNNKENYKNRAIGFKLN